MTVSYSLNDLGLLLSCGRIVALSGNKGSTSAVKWIAEPEFCDSYDVFVSWNSDFGSLETYWEFCGVECE